MSNPGFETEAESAARDAFERLGLTQYEAQVLIALQKLESGTASEIAQLSDVPRSQVYATAESLAELDLVDERQGRPITYRALSPEEARIRLQNRYTADLDRAFDYLESVAGVRRTPPEDPADIWTLDGADAVTRRVAQFLTEAQERVVFGASRPGLVPDRILNGLVDASQRGTDVVVMSRSDRVLEAAEQADIDCMHVPPERIPDIETGRLLMIDRSAVLLSLLTESPATDGEETALWSEDSAFADLLLQLLDQWFADTAVVQ